MCQLFAFFIDNEVHSIAEGYNNAIGEENYLLTKHNQVDMLSIVANDFDEAWNNLDLLCDPKLIEYTIGFIATN